MEIIILGAGVVGFQIANQLIAEGKDVVIIEKNPERAKYVSDHLDCTVINEEGNNILTLQKAGITKAEFFISVTDSDEVNMIACGLVSSELDIKFSVARVRNLDYTNTRILGKSFLGIDFVVNPEVESAKIIANIVALGADSDVMLFEETDVLIRNIIVEDDSFFKDKTLIELRKILKEPFLVAGIIRKNEFILPSGDTRIEKNDNIYLFATKKTLTKLFIKIGKKSEKIEKIIIVGGGRIGSLVAQYLIRTGRRITIIDSNLNTCKHLSEKFPEALILNNDIAEEDTFEVEQINHYDLIISTTNNEELNILTSVYAKSLGIKRTQALVTKTSYLSIASKLGIDSIVSPKICTVDAILKYIRRGNISSVHSLFDGNAEVIQFITDNNCQVLNTPLKELEFPKNSLILSIIRDKKNIIPDGNFSIKKGDTVILIVLKESINEIENIFHKADKNN